MKVLKVFVLIIILVGLIAGLVGLQAAFDGLSALRPGLYLSALERCGFFEDAPDLIIAAFSEQASSLPSSERAKFEEAVREAASPEWIRGQVSEALKDVSGFLTGKQEELTGVIHIEEFGDRFLESYGKTANPYVFTQVRKGMRDMFAQPLALKDLMAAPAFVEAGRYVRRGLDLATIVGVAWLVLAALTFLLAGGFPGGARWVGAACLVAGLVGLLASILAGAAATSFAAGFNLSGLPPDMTTRTQDLILAVIGGIIGSVRLSGLVVLVAGTVLFVLAGAVSAARARRRGGPAAFPGRPPAAAAKEGRTG